MRSLLLVISMMFVILAGCGNNSSQTSNESNGGEQMQENIAFETVEMQNAPKDVQTTVQQKWLEKSTFTIPSNDDLYIIITRGEMPTGGYSVSIDSIIKEGNEIVVSYFYTDPKKDDMVTQAITKPIVISKIDMTNTRVNFKEIQKSVPK
ncbi:protease complex subunit PrcB family protein [Guptibacillus hwajinpoensis]|uniref:protease complex subunit PrcB family protein n=1 Tax=Guptibacillus hwajinpoensis TaxID=208199 RepID=UPI001CFECFB9|nr:protease complex subunit PrcB family protein [Pseudalkalibacillus hwajinpoensis]WLR59443.1 protease complex subunit PrcB family protein [Pseudalkalibacillus hwajinpoensis]